MPQTDMLIWNAFVASVTNGPLPGEKIRPYDERLRGALGSFIEWLRSYDVDWQKSNTELETYCVGDQIHYVLPLVDTKGKITGPFCFTFLLENENWYFQHIESIFIRLDQVDSLPATTFPDVTDEHKAWMREEVYWSEQIRLFCALTAKIDKAYAYEWVKNGVGNSVGYVLGARTWVPFVDPKKAFILYLCWEESNLRGNKVTLAELNNTQARVVITDPFYFRLYKQSGHLRQLIAFEDYRTIYETIWLCRGTEAGWKLSIEFLDKEVIFTFT